MDIVSPSVRSTIMSKVRSKGAKSTERRLRGFLIRFGFRGWRINAHDITGTPDIVFDESRAAIFVDGCFWHGCPICYRRPKSKHAFWDAKLAENRDRDRRVTRSLRKRGWIVIRIFECELRDHPKTVIENIRSTICTA